MDGLISDIRVTLRNLRRRPAYTLVAVATLVLGIGVNVTIFSLVNGLFFKPIPGIEQPDRLVNISRAIGGDHWDMSFPIVQELRAGSPHLIDAAASAFAPVSVNDGGGPAVMMGMSVTGSYFTLLGLVPSAGTFFGEAQAFPTPAPVAVITHDLWQRRFRGASDVVGQALTVNGYSVQIVGVGPPGFSGHATGLRIDVFLPLGLPAPGLLTAESLDDVASGVVEVIGRLAPGATAAAAGPALTALATQRAEQSTSTGTRGEYLVRVDAFSPVPGPIRGGVTIFVGVLMSVVGLVLLMACTNVAGMFLFRSVQRRSEIAIRQALGAARLRVVRLIVIEGVVLFLIAGAAAILFARWATGLLLAFEPPTPPGYAIDLNLGLDWRVVSYALFITTVCGVLFALAPALRATRANLIPALRREATGSPAPTRFRSLLVFGQTAFTVLLLVVAGLFARAIASLESLDTGWVADDVHVITMDVELDGTDEASGRVFYAELLERVAGLAGVESASLAAKLPLAGSSRLGAVNAEGVPAPTGRPGHEAAFNRISRDYFRTLQIPLVRGRDFSRADGPDGPLVAVVNRAMASRLWGEPAAAIGQRFFVGHVGQGLAFEVVGVAGDAKYNRLTEEPQNFFYVPYAQRYNSQMSLQARITPGAVPVVRDNVERVIRELDPGLPVPSMRPLVESLEVFFLPQRMAAWVSGLMGALGLLLGAVGVYGVTSFNAAQRRHEMGVRLALGAAPGDIVSLVVRNGLVSPVLGLLAGLMVAFGATRLLSSLLAGISPLDPITFAAVVGVLGMVASIAVLVPALGAARADPVASFRTE